MAGYHRRSPFTGDRTAMTRARKSHTFRTFLTSHTYGKYSPTAKVRTISRLHVLQALTLYLRSLRLLDADEVVLSLMEDVFDNEMKTFTITIGREGEE